MYQLYTDGSYIPRLNSASIGGYLLDPDGDTVFDFSCPIEDPKLYNYHEICALEHGLRKCLELKIKNLVYYGDDQSLITILTKSPEYIENKFTENKQFRRLIKNVYNILPFFDQVKLTWISREKNQRADSLSKIYKTLEQQIQCEANTSPLSKKNQKLTYVFRVTGKRTKYSLKKSDIPAKTKALQRPRAALPSMIECRVQEQVKNQNISAFLYPNTPDKQNAAIFKILCMATERYYVFDFPDSNNQGCEVTRIDYNPYLDKIVAQQTILQNKEVTQLGQKLQIIEQVIKNNEQKKIGLSILPSLSGNQIKQLLFKDISSTKFKKEVLALEKLACAKHILLYNHPSIILAASVFKIKNANNSLLSHKEGIKFRF